MNYHQVYEKREREYCMSFYKKKKDKDKEKDQLTESQACISDNVTAKSTEETVGHSMKIRINFNLLTTGKVKN